MPWAAGLRVGVFEIVAPLGAGGMGEVYQARDTRLDRLVALKVLAAPVGRDPEALARFRREALTLAALNHPNIAIIHGLEELPDGTTALVMELVQGETLAARLARGRMEVEEALQIGAQMAEALEVAHAHDIVHRDVKPGNVMLGPRGLVKVLDFGLARRARGVDGSAEPGPAPTDTTAAPSGASDSLENAPTLAIRGGGTAAGETGPTAGAESLAGMAVGTPGYMSPEQVLAQPAHAGTDVFAVGCVLYECLTGRRAFAGRTAVEVMRATLSSAPDLSALDARVPARVRALVARCLQKDPGARPADMAAVRLEIEEALGIRRAAALRQGTVYGTPHNLAAPSTRFIGREPVLRECERLLDGTRLLTLVGMGGLGKTRLAQRLADASLRRHPDGVWLVNFASVTDPEHVPDVTAAALGVEDEPGRSPFEALILRVRDHRMLFVLDNCEHVLAGVQGLLAGLLARCPRVRVLATSREPLGVEGETVFPVPALALPDAGATDPREIMDVESVRLFVDRASTNDPTFTLDDHVSDVVEICRRLDGIPLALELAAARVRILGAGEVRARLGDRFRLLARPGHTGPSRQQTVRATIQWSWDHLLPPERDLMRRLAVFAGGWTLDRAAAVVSDDHDEFEVLDLLTRLVERSLVVVERPASASVRYRFLESVHVFALELLQSHPEYAELRGRHLDAYAALARSASVAMTGPGQVRQLAELVPEEENILAALAWCDHADDGAQRGLVIAEQFYRFWTTLGRYALARRVVEGALRRDAGNPPSAARARALTRMAGLLLTAGEADPARVYLEESLAFWRSSSDPTGLAAVVASLGVVAMYQARYEDAIRYSEESLELYRQRGERRGVAMALHNLGTIEQALARTDLGRARFEQALALLRESGDRNTEALCLSALATSRLRCGDPVAAHEAMRACLDRLEGLPSPREGVFALEALAELLLAGGRPLDAAWAVGAANAARTALKTPHTATERPDVERLGARLREAAGPDAIGEAMRRGRAASLAAALAEARRWVASLP